MAGPNLLREVVHTQADYKGRRALKSCLSEFHRILDVASIGSRTILIK